MSRAILSDRQPVYTVSGPVPVSSLVGQPFLGITRDPSGSLQPCWLQADRTDPGDVIGVDTRVGPFRLAPDAEIVADAAGLVLPLRVVRSADGRTVHIWPVSRHVKGYAWIWRRKHGKMIRELLHRCVARDVMGFDIEGRTVHHVNGVKTDSRPENLQVLSRSEHASLHYQETAALGLDPFAPRPERPRRTAPDRPPITSRRHTPLARPTRIEETGRCVVTAVMDAGTPASNVMLWPITDGSPFGKGILVCL